MKLLNELGVLLNAIREYDAVKNRNWLIPYNIEKEVYASELGTKYYDTQKKIAEMRARRTARIKALRIIFNIAFFLLLFIAAICFTLIQLKFWNKPLYEDSGDSGLLAATMSMSICFAAMWIISASFFDFDNCEHHYKVWMYCAIIAFVSAFVVFFKFYDWWLIFIYIIGIPIMLILVPILAIFNVSTFRATWNDYFVPILLSIAILAAVACAISLTSVLIDKALQKLPDTNKTIENLKNEEQQCLTNINNKINELVKKAKYEDEDEYLHKVYAANEKLRLPDSDLNKSTISQIYSMIQNRYADTIPEAKREIANRKHATIMENEARNQTNIIKTGFQQEIAARNAQTAAINAQTAAYNEISEVIGEQNKAMQKAYERQEKEQARHNREMEASSRERASNAGKAKNTLDHIDVMIQNRL